MIKSEDVGKDVYTKDLKVGDIIKSEAFANLLYKDIYDLDPMAGFYVNPIKEIRHWDNTVGKMIESNGRVFISSRNEDGTIKKSTKSIRFPMDPERCYVVKSKTFERSESKEQISEDSMDGQYPLEIVATMMAPDGSYDEFGLEITFYTNSSILLHVVNMVKKIGFYEELIPF